MLRRREPFAQLRDPGNFPKQWMSGVCCKKPVESIGMAGNDTDRAERFQLILDTTECQAAIAH
jgi:hypothetical protein